MIGATVFHNGSLDINQKSGEIAYPAGCVTVTWDPNSQQQTRFLSALPRESAKLKPITSTTFSPDGRRLACAESGHSPSIFIWDLENRSLLFELKSHTLGVATMCFTPDSKHLISIGTEHDQQLNIWDFKSSSPLRGCKVTSKVHSIAMSEDGAFFVTVGLRHFRIWTKDLVGHSITCGSFKDHEFVDAVCGTDTNSDRIYAVSREGLLFVMDAKLRQLSMHIDLHCAAYALTFQTNLLVVACAKGVVRLMNASNLDYIASLPKPNPIGQEVVTSQVDIVKPQHKSLSDSGATNIYPDAVAVKSVGNHVAVFYNNRALFVWDIQNVKQVGKYRSFIAHSSCIWGLDVFPARESGAGSGAVLPENSFASCSADGSIRIWNVEEGEKNIFCKELVSSLWLTPAEEVYQGLVSSGPVDGLGGSLVGSSSATMAMTGGVRSIRISPDGNEIASGDRSGNIRVHRVSDFALVSLQEAHESEVLCLAYTNGDVGASRDSSTVLLASGSRDRLIHLFARTDSRSSTSSSSSISTAFTMAKVSGVEGHGYKLVSTVEDHSASITGLAFSDFGKHLFSTSADKSVILRHVSPDGQSLKRYHNTILHGAMLDVKVVPFKQWIVCAGQDRKMYVYDSNTGAVVRTIPSLSDADILKIELDKSGLLLATASQDRILRLYNFATGELLASMAGHAELLTSVKFSANGTSLISASGDGCIFIWTIASDLVAATQSRYKQLRSNCRLPPSSHSPYPASSPSYSTAYHHHHQPQHQHGSPSSAPSSIKSARRSVTPQPSPPSSGKRPSSFSSAGSLLLERLISPAFHPNWVNNDHEGLRNKPANDQSVRGAWASRGPPEAGITIATNSTYAAQFGPLIIESSTKPLSWRDQLLGTGEHESLARRVLTSSKRSTTSSSPSSSLSSSLSPSSSDSKKDVEDSPSIFFQPAIDDSASVGPVIRSIASPPSPSLPNSSTSTREEDEVQTWGFEGEVSDDPSTFFHDLQSASSPDFLHEQNFGNLDHAFVPTKSTIKGRKSISARYFLKKPVITTTPPPSSSCEPAGTSSSVEPPPSISASSDQDRKDQMAKEVERTKARLRELGITFGRSPAPSKSVVSSSSSSLPPSSASPSLVDDAHMHTHVPQPTTILRSPIKSTQGSSISKSMGDLPNILTDPEDLGADNMDTSEGIEAVEGEEAIASAEDGYEETYEAEPVDSSFDHLPPRPAFLESLMSGFDRTVELYKELKESKQQDDMVLQFRSVFSEMKSALDMLSSEDPILSNMASNRTFEMTGSTTLECSEAAMLERYSELLVGMVRSKLDYQN